MKCSLPKIGIFYLRLIPTRQKTMTNCFRKRDFMQPKGRVNMHSGGGVVIWLFFFLVQSLPLQLAQARNSFGNEKYMRAMGRVNHALQVVGFLFLLNLGVGERSSFHLSFWSEHVPSMLFSSSQWVPIRFAMCSRKVFPIGTHFNPIYFGQSHPLLAYRTGPKGRNSIFG
jgi:hypothetical protein